MRFGRKVLVLVAMLAALLSLVVAPIASANPDTKPPVSVSPAPGTPLPVDPKLNIAPPPGFDPLTASDADLAKHGFPHRPADPTRLARWNAVMQHAKTYVPPTAELAANKRYSTLYSTIWAGFINQASLNKYNGYTIKYNEVTSDWTQPSVSPASSPAPEVAFWNGIGGWNGSQALVQAGATSIASNPVAYKFFYEDVPGPPYYLINLTLKGGDRVSTDVSYSAATGTATHFFINMTTNTYTSTTQPASSYDGSSADFITEKPPTSAILPYFAPSDFNNCSASWVAADGTTGGGIVGAYNYDKIIMTTTGTYQGTMQALPSDLLSNLQSFTMT